MHVEYDSMDQAGTWGIDHRFQGDCSRQVTVLLRYKDVHVNCSFH